MKKLTFELTGQEYIELNKLLKFMGLVDSGGEAFLRIDQGEVKVNGVTESRRRMKLRPGDRVLIDQVSVEIIQGTE